MLLLCVCAHNTHYYSVDDNKVKFHSLHICIIAISYINHNTFVLAHICNPSIQERGNSVRSLRAAETKKILRHCLKIQKRKTSSHGIDTYIDNTSINDVKKIL